MLISDQIARLIETLIEESGGTIDLKRNDMAEQLGCAPSQINYVITSRFTPERGYIIESRRGGGGYIRIVRKALHKNEYLAELLDLIGDRLDEGACLELLRRLSLAECITKRELHVIGALLSPAAFSSLQTREMKETVRADMARRLLLSLME